MGYAFRCPHCERELAEIIAREEDGPEPAEGACPHCGERFNLQAAHKLAADRAIGEIVKDTQRKLDEISRRRR